MAIAKSEKRRKIASSPSAVTPKRRGVDLGSPLAKRGLAASPAGSPSSPITPRAKSVPLPSHLSRMIATHTALESTLSLSLATSSRAPSQITGHLPAITNTVAIESAGLRVRCGVEELRRLCWLWEWDGCTLPQSANEDHNVIARSVGPLVDSSEDNPFLDSNTPRKPVPAPAPPPIDWVRGGMGLIVTPTTQLQRAEGRRVPAYGIGIKVEVTPDESVGVALSAVAKWTADSHLRRKELTDKLHQWVKLNEVSQITPKANKTKRLRSLSPVPIPPIPFADLPPLSSISITSTPSTQRILQSPSKGMFSTPSRGTVSTPTFARRQGGFATPSTSGRSIFATPSHRKGGIFATPTSVHRSGAGTPSARKGIFDAAPPMTPTSRAAGVPLPLTPATTPSLYSSSASESGDSRPCTPCTNRALFKVSQDNLDPQTPRKDKDANASVPKTPRQAALAERLRQRSLATPGKTTVVTLGYDAETDTIRTAEATPAELRRRCLLARLPDAAETLLAMFASRRIIPLREAARSIVSASRVTTQEAEDEIRMLADMCPKFLRIRVVERDEWVERGTGVIAGKAANPGVSKSSVQPVSSPARKGVSSPSAKAPSTPARNGSRATGGAKPVATTPSSGSPASATPRKAKEVEAFGLREIRELVRRELEGVV
ncbi:hypothetical protein RSOLAG22IIIB_06528 [Rhizoctonia solani]|uniref:DNA replication factor Cdt1 C-terminal domain-containing protein n=1 Tax=Rhizoctonia solani TaxID=456999 RepID=A0A0K6GEV3_9AGAM|nr:hypothetical protein RSOLAG22IIIB_06528 [Rhizoctonia solani]